MEKVLLLSCFLTVCSAIFFPFFNLGNGNQSMMNVCIYSVDTTQYAPKCFMCPTNAYTSVLVTCVQGASMPLNVSFTQARCLEQNCAIRRGRRSIPTEGDKDNLFELPQSKGAPSQGVELHELGPPKKSSTNYDSNKRQHDKGILIVGQEETFAGPDEDLEIEYEQDYGD